MSRFKPASAEEMARRGLNPDGSPIKKPVIKKPAKKTDTSSSVKET